MAPPSDEVYAETSFTGIPRDMIDAALEVADRDGTLPRDVYAAALDGLLARVARGDVPAWPSTRPNTGGKPYHVRLEAGVLARMRAACALHRVRRNVFFLVALADWLRARGRVFEP